MYRLACEKKQNYSNDVMIEKNPIHLPTEQNYRLLVFVCIPIAIYHEHENSMMVLLHYRKYTTVNVCNLSLFEVLISLDRITMMIRMMCESRMMCYDQILRRD